MVTYSELVQFVIMLIAFAGLIVQISKRKCPPLLPTMAVKFLDKSLRE